MVSVVGLFLRSQSINGAPPEIPQKKSYQTGEHFFGICGSLILRSKGRSISLSGCLVLLFPQLASRATQYILQTLARPIDAGLHRLRADAEKLRAFLLRTAFDGK